jgi:hypothetical protein
VSSTAGNNAALIDYTVTPSDLLQEKIGGGGVFPVYNFAIAYLLPI